MRVLRGAWSQRYRKPSEKEDILSCEDRDLWRRWLEELPGMFQRLGAPWFCTQRTLHLTFLNPSGGQKLSCLVGGRPSHLGGGDKEHSWPLLTEGLLAQQGAVHFSTTARFLLCTAVTGEWCLSLPCPRPITCTIRHQASAQSPYYTPLLVHATLGGQNPLAVMVRQVQMGDALKGDQVVEGQVLFTEYMGSRS